jgi:hypothetical protein
MDPLIRVLSTAKGQLSWLALQNMGIPVSYRAFAARWDSEEPNDQQDVEILKNLVDKFDANGITIKSDDGGDSPEVKSDTAPSEVSKMAKRATKLGK